MAKIKLLITDFDGTLVDTFDANFLAYREAFENFGLSLSQQQYRDNFGLRFDDFMASMGVEDTALKQGIKAAKCDIYPLFFDHLKVNRPLLTMLRNFKLSGGLTAVASTARRKNLLNVLDYIGSADAFSLVLAGEDVKNGKPSPEIYNTVLERMGVLPNDALVFEDSPVGIEAATAAHINHIQITKNYFYEDTSERA